MSIWSVLSVLLITATATASGDYLAVSVVARSGTLEASGRERHSPTVESTVSRAIAPVRGRVVAMDTGAPLMRSQVSIVSTDGAFQRVVETNADGRYEFSEIPQGRYRLSARKSGYLSSQFGQRHPHDLGAILLVTDSLSHTQIDLALPRESVIAGRLADNWGEPMARAQVRALRIRYDVDGQQHLVSSQAAMTDDRGEFRLFGLLPGQYIVCARTRVDLSLMPTAGAESVETFVPGYFPGTSNPAEAVPISLGIGEEKSVNFLLIAGRYTRLHGTVVDSRGAPLSDGQIRLLTRFGNRDGLYGAGNVLRDGSFALSDIPPGEYLIEVRSAPRRGVTAEFASVPVTVGHNDIDAIYIRSQPAITVAGRVKFEGNARRLAEGHPLRANVDPVAPDERPLSLAGSSDTNGRIDATDHFEMAGVVGTVFFTVVTPDALMVKSVTLNGRDITDVPIGPIDISPAAGLVITLTDRFFRVVGQVTDARGQVVPNCVVVIQPAEQQGAIVSSRWIRVVRSDDKGHFEVNKLRPGRYLATATESLEENQQYSPEIQAYLSRTAQEFSLRETGSMTIDLALRLTNE